MRKREITGLFIITVPFIIGIVLLLNGSITNEIFESFILGSTLTNFGWTFLNSK